MASNEFDLKRVEAVAAPVIFVCSPLLRVVLFVAAACWETSLPRSPSEPTRRARGTVYGLEATQLVSWMVLIGAAASVVASLNPG
ncbi:hypothetical protein I41_28290 [Lacipirellula limnantheis]|uniref:Uncharacterized protein n=1 Tax=Lacipirellula limnantheis TaxID=2528024 RepID=A0A517TZ36_9BACT|nr:hypothetical protein I41_28290 [Lacipirellula limnantheis]